VIIDVLCVDWHVDVVVFSLKSCESCHNLALFVRLQKGLCWSKFDLILVLVWNFPFVLQRNSRLVFHVDILFSRNSNKSWREKQLLFVAEVQSGLVTMANEVDFSHICWVVVKDALSNEIVVSS